MNILEIFQEILRINQSHFATSEFQFFHFEVWDWEYLGYPNLIINVGSYLKAGHSNISLHISVASQRECFVHWYV